jgi:integrase
VRARPAKPRTNIVTPDDAARLLAVAPPWIRVIILLASRAGFRRSDCLRIAPQHYDAANRTITIRQKKTHEPVTVPVTDELAETLDAAPDAGPATPYCEAYRGKPITPNGLGFAWRKLRRLARVPDTVWIHDLRRTLAVSLYDVSKDLRIVEQALGHKSISTTTRYIEHRDPAKLRPYLDAMFIPKGPVQ